ncbi:hypothetical protein ATN84_22435 [Paramesorhizobium deserti]|uniref:AB hydrolase-1 domain-containing protein n=2 Tax=Paramesorhizobium deserti TaxID=1494590 RepID=A0A135HN84_9HYPH|nr:hypothetical protein ATN84_22435 [Paramesorhizobium deserti]
MATARLDNVEIYYEIHGEGRPLVLIAGYTCDHTFWEGVLPHLAKRFRVITFDNRGIGSTADHGEPFSVDTMAADAAGLIRHLGLEKPAVVGQSMGGAIVQTLQARFPEICGPCAILNSSQRFDTVAIKALESLLELRKANVDFDLLIDATLPWLSGSEWLSNGKNIADFKHALLANPAPQSVADQERQLIALKSFDARTWNKPWKHPAMVISATEDRVASVHEGRNLARSLNARFAEVPGGHASPVEQAGKVSELLLAFLHG